MTEESEMWNLAVKYGFQVVAPGKFINLNVSEQQFVGVPKTVKMELTIFSEEGEDFLLTRFYEDGTSEEFNDPGSLEYCLDPGLFQDEGYKPI